ncbi:Transcriptional regulator, contains XRE-family HTH domain [Izhakiella capsodis]|uniref:Transcriptional regulator, contains XRE-family HTH domain n=1 Tax=Izhakiella capsodis TaxID=1367852 RepID=A0A1I5BR48_9GAMM|nr:helix-turn-helix domain-containing protein [Izhakiella capsodis]SFN77126.1 Transcriptional regulator, contains XRE-family HTH domain [Izhakiella capsodis]
MSLDNNLYVLYDRQMGKPWREIVKSLMREQGITQEKMAEHFELTKGGISHWLNGRRDPGLQEITSMLSFLGVSSFVVLRDGTIEVDKDSSPKLDSDNKHEHQELIDIFSALPDAEAKRFLSEMKARKAHFDAIFEEMLKKRHGKAS